ncbi:hypothetical protein IWZ01DRAFT_536275 [Phyllosticta capitalensis]
MRFLVVIAVLFQAYFSDAGAYLSVPWSERSYGPDGPWQAIRVYIQYFGHYVDLTPSIADYGGFGASFFLQSDTFCGTSWAKDNSCGQGGTFNTHVDYAEDDHREIPTSEWADLQYKGTNRSSSGKLWFTNLDIPGTRTINSTWAGVCDYDFAVTPGGLKYRPPTGSIVLDTYASAEKLPYSSVNPVHLLGCKLLECLVSSSEISTISYGLHYGSASLNFTGSLVLGGYDQGRIMGKSAQVANDKAQLLDISLGVEAGDSPFSEGFTLKSGFLSSPLSMTIDSLSPGLYLPGGACSRLASHLPVTFDSSSGYYLWNVMDPAFKRLMGSPAFMAFTFPPSAADSNNVTIKVPFRLFNLTLEHPIMDVPTPYFPCFDKSEGYLGRVFLQAAFVGRNYHSNSSWLAQAPGPGRNNSGLGVVLKEISTDDTEIQGSPLGDMTWMKSWENYLTPLSDDSQTSPNSTNSSDSSDTIGDNYRRAIVAGTVGGVVVLIIIAAGILVWWKWIRIARKSDESDVQVDECEHGCPQKKHILGCPRFAHPVVLPGTEVYEMAAFSTPLELSSERRVTKLSGDSADSSPVEEPKEAKKTLSH